MKIEITAEFDERMKKTYPIVVKAERAIYNTMGVTLEDMRSRSCDPFLTQARILFCGLTYNNVRPNYYIAFYLNRDHTTNIYWKKKYNDLKEWDRLFADLADRVQQEFESIE